MGAAFSTEIDLEDVIGRGSSASASMFKLSQAFENLAESVGSANSSSGQFAELARKMDDAVKSVTASIRTLVGSVDGVGKRLTEFGWKGENAMLAVRVSAILAGYAIRFMMGPLRLIIWAFDLLSKMNPFGFLSKAYDQFMKIYDKIKELSKGSTSLGITAKGMRTTAKNLTNFEKAYELVGFDRSVISDITNAIDGGALGDLAAIGLDSEALKKLDGIEAFFKIYEAAQKFAQNMGGTESVAAKQVLGNLENISSALSVQSLRGTSKEYAESKEYYRELQRKDKSDPKAMSDFEKAWTQLSHSFGNLVNLVAGKLAPALTKLTKILKGVIDTFVEWLDNGPLEKFVAAWNSFVDWIIEIIKNPKKLLWDTPKAAASAAAANRAGGASRALPAMLREGDYAGYASKVEYQMKKAGGLNLDKSLIEEALKKVAGSFTEEERRRLDITFSANGVMTIAYKEKDESERILARQQVLLQGVK